MDESDDLLKFQHDFKSPNQYHIGSEPILNILQSPKRMTPSYSENFSKFLNLSSSGSILTTHIGNTNNTRSKINHNMVRNTICHKNDILFDSNIADIRLINDFNKQENWSIDVPSISTRSLITHIEVNNKGSFGVCNSLNTKSFFSVNHDYDNNNVNFKDISFFQFDDQIGLDPITETVYYQVYDGSDSESHEETEIREVPVRITDISVSDFIEGEFCFVTNNGYVSLYNCDRMISCTKPNKIVYSPFSSITVCSNPRIVCASFKNDCKIIDFRKIQGNDSSIKINIDNVTALHQLTDPNKIFYVNDSHFGTIDIRFPTKPNFQYPFSLSTNVLSLKEYKDKDQLCVFGLCNQSAEIIAFNFSDTSFSHPSIPFDITFLEYNDQVKQTIVGFEVIDSTCIIKYENQLVCSIPLREGYDSQKHYITCIDRVEKEFSRDIIDYKPSLDEMTFDIPDDNFLAFEDLKLGFPTNFIKSIDKSIIPDEEIDEYLSSIQELQETDFDDMRNEIKNFWKSHMKMANNYIDR